ncbi:MAG: 50S ribosomal protein L35 [Patescibacteria group bacterium]
MKLKTVKSAQKRIKITRQGKILRRQLSAQHLTQGKSKRVRRAAGKLSQIAQADKKKIKKLVPYG